MDLINQFCESLDKNIREVENVLICVQKGNDLDTMGSALSMAKLIELNFENIKNIRILQINVRRTVLGDIKPYLPSKEETIEEDKTLFLTVDINDPEQIFPVNYEIAKKCKKVVQIDHHDNSLSICKEEEDFEVIRLVLPLYCSCSEIIWDIAKQLKWKRNKEIAEILFYGLYSDSRNLVGQKVNEKTFKTIYEFSKAGADTTKVMRHLNSQSLKEMYVVADLIKEAYMDGNLLLLNLHPKIVFKYFPKNLHVLGGNRIQQRKLLTYPLNVLEFSVKANTIIYIHYSLISPFNGKNRFVFVVLVKPNEKIERLLLENGFIKQRNRYSRAIDIFEMTKIIENNKDLLKE